MAEAEGEVPDRIRLQVYLAHCGVGSRRGCAHYIEEGRVEVNGVTVTDRAYRVNSLDEVSFDGELVEPEQEKRYIVLNKPPKYLSSSYDPEGRPIAVDLLKAHFGERLYNVGRLDFMSEGLLIFTNDGDFALKVGHPSSEIEKEYLVELGEPEKTGSDEMRRLEEFLRKAKRGVEIDGVLYTIRSFTFKSSRSVKIRLIEGKNREIRRMFAHLELPVGRLSRVRIGPVRIDDIPSGEYRNLSTEEIRILIGQENKDRRDREEI